ncbi:cupin domain-containing protein [Paucibacter sp. B2R-40]|uniref:cupin domain-containing protein n=1 Tax=Paucibacter sp. B2R-40 TaxID=2893554 RepID=UPI0021E3AD21|nr:cupin domain-containing protein [Paucibacter sp. B2R-40]MCV2353725.1 cupin domain-containing protein [Paucibacter sp. B2R-40]
MSTPIEPSPETSHHKSAELRQKLIRNFLEIPRERFLRDPVYESMVGGVSEGTVARKLGCGVDTVPPGKQSCPYHFHHSQEEMFIVLEGSGTLRVAGELLSIKAGDVIFIPCGPEYPHHILNTSDAELKYLSISTQDRPEVCEYPDSEKIAIFSKGPAFIQRRDNSLDYWEGER